MTEQILAPIYERWCSRERLPLIATDPQHVDKLTPRQIEWLEHYSLVWEKLQGRLYPRGLEEWARRMLLHPDELVRLSVSRDLRTTAAFRGGVRVCELPGVWVVCFPCAARGCRECSWMGIEKGEDPPPSTPFQARRLLAESKPEFDEDSRVIFQEADKLLLAERAVLALWEQIQAQTGESFPDIVIENWTLEQLQAEVQRLEGEVTFE